MEQTIKEDFDGERTGPKDVFLHLLMMVMLYASAVSFLVLTFQYVNILIPDVTEFDYAYRLANARGLLRGALATLIVVFPVYIFSVRLLRKDYGRNPTKRDLKSRKWLVYFTLFVSALLIIGDLVTLIRTFLEGDLTLRFILKVLSVLFVAGAIFGYYLWEIRHEKLDRIKSGIYAVIGVVIIVAIAGFFIVGSPKNERLRELDRVRVSNLQYIQSEIVYYWQNKETLPESLEALNDDLRGVRIPKDPETREPYEYEVTGPLSFTLCAVFSLPSIGEEENGRMIAPPQPTLKPYAHEVFPGISWEHGAGRVCFTRTIDPDVFRRRE